jgi:hypothetical protein
VLPDNARPGIEERVQLFPNPVQAQAVFRYTILTQNRAELSLFDMQGRQVEIIFNETKSPGTYDHQISRENLEPGIYFFRFKAGDYLESGKMVILD